MKIRLVGAELFHADGQTDMTTPILAFRSIAKSAPELTKSLSVSCSQVTLHVSLLHGTVGSPGQNFTLTQLKLEFVILARMNP
jgi:hypothetical protein